MTLITLGLVCPHLGRRHRWLAGVTLARWFQPPLPVLGLLAGAARLLWATPHFGPDDVVYYNDQGRVRLVGVVADEPDVRDIYQNLRLPAPCRDGAPVRCGTGARRVAGDGPARWGRGAG